MQMCCNVGVGTFLSREVIIKEKADVGKQCDRDHSRVVNDDRIDRW